MFWFLVMVKVWERRWRKGSVLGSEFMAYGCECRRQGVAIQGLAFSVEDVGFRVQELRLYF